MLNEKKPYESHLLLFLQTSNTQASILKFVPVKLQKVFGSRTGKAHVLSTHRHRVGEHSKQ